MFLPSPEVSGREGLAEWKAEIGDCVQEICSEALSRSEVVACFFSRRAWNVGECAEGYFS
ncbi:hypothetical protein [Croceitalea sp. MTPC6]|uniref:hypothetical protein n=1 Tax=Croceitalea sp. MTPC6 TaxID=3056566 RepID=UPI0030D7FC03